MIMDNNIEKFLGLTQEIIERRKQNLRYTIRTDSGTGYLETRMKQFDVQPWPFISYLAHYCPDLLNEAFSHYKNYDGAENREVILEGLREKHITWGLIKDIHEEKKRENYMDVEFEIAK